MTKFLLAVHVLAAVIAIGPVTVAASMFPAAVRRAGSGADAAEARASIGTLHRICQVYAVVGVAVPVFGLATANEMGVLGDTWLIVSMVLTAGAAVILAALILPRQSALLEVAGAAAEPVPAKATARLAMYTGLFNILWATVTVLMIVRPGSTTGA
ncbi:DUF2269 family protein [Streptomyces sp. AK02-01A]|uniref:DUF2269 family protein n=1 Tax=Streptomyces sp. AK02-01A TaxID=3028648 RepID=UPI0029AB834B|nr:DUF2269 family protein [Streptomyces sp. AK02-01A]MDX3849232.1 DUF2269 family protein [Streptomyces sp. AK02-01A]